MISNERLNFLATRFIDGTIAALLGITFQEYLTDPEGHDQTALYLVAGGSLCTYHQTPRPVGKARRKPVFNPFQKAI